MRLHLVPAFAAILHFGGIACGDEARIKFADAAPKALRDAQPLRAEITRKDGKIHLSLVNVSTKHVVITKSPYSFNGYYEAVDGSKLGEFGGATDAGTMEFSDHVVVRPQTEVGRTGGIDWSSWEIWETVASHENASVIAFELKLGGYFPGIGEYLSFTVTGRLDLGTSNGEQAGAGQPATAPESKPEGVEKPGLEPKPAPR